MEITSLVESRLSLSTTVARIFEYKFLHEIALDTPAGRRGAATEAEQDDRLRSILQGVLGALFDIVVPASGRDDVPAHRGGCRPRRFLAEVRFTIDGPSSVHLRIVDALHAHGTAIVCAPSEVENVRDYHLHTVHPGAVVSELYAIATPFGLTIDSTEPPLDGTMP